MSLAEQLSVITHAPPVTMTPARAQRPNPAPGAFSAFEEPGRTSVPTRRAVRRVAEDNTLLNGATCAQQCLICMDTIKVGHVCRTLPCTHTFHKHCLDNLIHAAGHSTPPKWTQCPECRLHLHPGNDFESIASRTIEHTRRAAIEAEQDMTRGLPMGATVAASFIRTATVSLQQQAAAAADAAALSFARALNAMERLRRLIRTHRRELQHFYYVPADL